jgi:hypothetical protein
MISGPLIRIITELPGTLFVPNQVSVVTRVIPLHPSFHEHIHALFRQLICGLD